MGDLLAGILEAARPVVTRKDVGGDMDRLCSAWRGVVGAPISDLTEVVRLRGGKLRVRVATAPLVSELALARPHLLGALAEAGIAGVLDLAFEVGEVSTGGRAATREGSHPPRPEGDRLS